MIRLVRHGVTRHSRAYVASGRRHLDVDIEPQGAAQARLAAVALRGYPCQRAICSSYARTRTSARLILGDDVPLAITPEIDEVDYGSFDGGPWRSYGDWLSRQGLHARPPGGSESWAEALVRALKAVVEIDADEIPTVVVCHGYLWSALAQYIGEGLLPSPSRLGAPAPYGTPLAPEAGRAADFLRDWSESFARQRVLT